VERERNPFDGLELFRDERLIGQRREQGNESRFDDGSHCHTDYRNKTYQFVWRHIAPQATINNSDLGIYALAHVTPPGR
jgi:hypothetical protein